MRDTLSRKTVGELRTLIVGAASVIEKDASIDQLLAKIISDPLTRHVYVIDERRKLIGAVRLNSVVKYLFPHEALWNSLSFHSYEEYMEAEKVSDLMNDKPRYVTDSTSVSEMAEIMMDEKINELPVVDDEHRVVGEVNMLEAIAAYISANE